MDCIKQDRGSDMKKSDVICFGGNDWWYHNRNHFDVRMMEIFAKYGNVLYVNSIVMQKPNVRQGRKFIKKLIRKAKSICRGLKKSGVGFWVYSPVSLPVCHIRWLRPLNEMLLQFQLWLVNRKLDLQNPIVWVACPVVCDVAINMKKSRLVYQRTDCFEEFPGVDVQIIKDYDQKLKATADITLFVNRILYEEESDKCKKAIYLDHGVDFDAFASPEKSKDIPREMRDLGKPIVGFFGQIDDYTVDIGFIEKVVDYLPEKSFVFVGEAALADCCGLMARKNVWMLGKKPYEQIPHYGKCFDVAIMPWRQNRWIQACNPIKLKEYLALGKPIVSTPFPELQKYLDVVCVATTPKQFAKCIERAINEDSPEQVAARRGKVKKATWGRQAELVLHELFNEE
jgi:glycosyltransferase involved in cell wall biosynthesis